ncbi:hypothetical protein SAMN04488542_12083 [Fontibacillus panacisegetis]|uniref:Uncharacterized protein n=1 Tax=Fontibacillus panacisegetis TaxID=670482 RepID=A0A1G7Q1D3_9BACL|nr:hypothetical protein SAMN04488542_12083 [Fontibacillus panacisegetis]
MPGNDSLGRPPQQAIFEFSRKGKSQKCADVLRVFSIHLALRNKMILYRFQPFKDKVF